MKTFTEIERREIEKRIREACSGTQFEGAVPQCLIKPGPVMCDLHFWETQVQPANCRRFVCVVVNTNHPIGQNSVQLGPAFCLN